MWFEGDALQNDGYIILFLMASMMMKMVRSIKALLVHNWDDFIDGIYITFRYLVV